MLFSVPVQERINPKNHTHVKLSIGDKKMNIKTCKHCGDEFDFDSQEKRRVGGYVNECCYCVEELGTETSVRYRGVVSGDGKMAAISIVKFDSETEFSDLIFLPVLMFRK